MAQRIEIWPVDRVIPYARNPRMHADEQVAQIAASIAEFGFLNPILVDTQRGIVAGHGRLLAARMLQLAEVPVIVLDHLSDNQRRAYIIADNKLALNAGWDDQLLASELAELEREGLDLALTGFSEEELGHLLGRESVGEPGADQEDEEEIPEAPVEPATRAGDFWQIGRHRVICGDCRDESVIVRLFGGTKANLAITSPPYATQREYDPASGFQPVPPDEYVEWFRSVAANIRAVLAADGSYFLNIKEHAEDGERSLYVKDLVLAHKRQWGWRFVDEFCWRKTDNGVPGGWNNRFKNAWEPVFHFCRQAEIKFRPVAVGHLSDDCFGYSPNNPKSPSGSALLGNGPRGLAAGQPGAEDGDGLFTGIARPSNVIEVKSESSQGSHSAPFPRALVEFFTKAFSDPGDIVFDPFLGSGTTMAAAQVLSRTGYGIEISPAYCDVILRRIAQLTAQEPILTDTGQSITEVAAERGVPDDQVLNPKLRDSRRIQHHGPAPFYGSHGGGRAPQGNVGGTL
jgi:DNA modification methylase